MSATPADRRTATLEFLRRHGADTTPHIFGDLLSHLSGWRRWCGPGAAPTSWPWPRWGTPPTAPTASSRTSSNWTNRSVLVATIGPEAEALVYFYASCDRDAFYPQLTSPDTGPGRPALPGPLHRRSESRPSADVRDALRRPDLRQRGRAGGGLTGRPGRVDMAGRLLPGHPPLGEPGLRRRADALLHRRRLNARGAEPRPLRSFRWQTDRSRSWRCTPTPTTKPSARAGSWPATPTKACARCW